MRRILIIDDDDVMREAAAASLSTVGGYRVLTTGDPEEGLRLARAEAPDGVLLDVSMPGMEGPEVLAALQGDPATRDIPVVFFTGGSKSSAADRWGELGVSGAVAKPFDFSSLPGQFARMVGWDDAPEAEAPTPDPATPVPTTIQGIWERRREEVEGRVRTIEDVALALMEDRLTGDLLQDGIRAAHQLTGTLGSFGFAGGSVLAGEAEALLRAGESPLDRSAAVRLSELVLGLDRALEQGPSPTPAPAPGNLKEEPEGPDPPAEEPRQRRVGGEGRAERHVDVVIVDDDAALSDLLDHTLRLRGYTVERFSDGADAAAALVGDPPAVSGRAILLDVGLPGLDGLAVLRRLRREGLLQRTQVLMLTSHAMESEVLQALELGAFDHVAKPFSVPILMHRLQRALTG